MPHINPYYFMRVFCPCDMMQSLTIKSIKAKSHANTKFIFWHLFAASKGGSNRIRIVSYLRNNPANVNQIAQHVHLDYKSARHHVNVLKTNNLLIRTGGKYGAIFSLSSLFEEGQETFDEILTKLSLNNK